LQGKITAEEVNTVKDLIEKSLLVYMDQQEVIHALQVAEIDPGFTLLGKCAIIVQLILQSVGETCRIE
jgi:hypothetical protein